MLRVVLMVVSGLALLALAAWGYGLTLPREHRAVSQIALSAPIDSVWKVIRDVGGVTAWHKDFTRSDPAPARNGHEVWTQEGGGQTMAIELVEITPPTRLVTEIVNDGSAPWGGRWSYELRASGTGTVVTITEDGWVGPALFRTMMKVRGAHATMDAYLTSLAKRFGETATPAHV